MKKQQVITRLLVLAAIIVVVNLIANKAFFRLDFTADQRYTLSKATENILTELNDVVTINAYFSEDLPPQLLSARKDFEDQLIEYENRSNGYVVYEFVNPNEDDESEKEAQKNGIQPIVINVQERDQVQQMRAYMGAVVQVGDQKEVIPVIQPGGSLEYILTTAIKKLTVLEKPKIALLQGHGEPPLQGLLELNENLSVLYDVEEYTISDTASIPSTYKAIAIIDPTDSIPDSHLMKLDNFMKDGGGIYIAYDQINGDLSNGQTIQKGTKTGLETWLKDKGVELSEMMVTDINSGSVQAQQRVGPLTIPVQVKFPYFPKIDKFEEHPAVKGLESVMFQFSSPITTEVKDSAIQVTPLIYTSEQSGQANAPLFIDISKKWTEADFTEGKQMLAVALEGPLVGTKTSRLVVIGNGDFAVNGVERPQRLNADNVNLATNAIDWLSDDTGLIDLRTKGITSRPLETVEDGTKDMLKYGNVFAPILLILLYGFVRKQQYARKKQQWLEGKY